MKFKLINQSGMVELSGCYFALASGADYKPSGNGFCMSYQDIELITASFYPATGSGLQFYIKEYRIAIDIGTNCSSKRTVKKRKRKKIKLPAVLKE